MSVTGVIFDLDGTLLDTLDDLADSMNTVLARSGLPTHPRDAYRRFVGDGVTMLVRRALPAGGNVPIEGMVDAMRAEYARRWDRRTAPYAGVPEMLRELGGRGIRLGVLTNKPHDAALEVVGRFLGRERFGGILGARPGVPHKPDPTSARELLAALGCEPASVLYVGDSGTDMDTARAAGLRAVGVLWGFRDRDELLAHGAWRLVERPAQILELCADPPAS